MEEKKKNPKQCQSHLVTVHELVKGGYEALQNCNKANPNIEAEILALHILGYTKLERILNANRLVSEEEEDQYNKYISKRCSGIPLQYITKEQDFMGLSFYVDEHVLIPRQDTETLVETLLEKAKVKSFKRMIEIGVGSGCISISLAKFLPHVQITGIDISPGALEIAEKNAKANQVEDQIQWIQSNLFDHYRGGPVDLIVSNPPYITSKDYNELEAEVKDHEPMLALEAGQDGLGFYREITKQAKKHLVRGGILAYEIGYNQSAEVSSILEENDFLQIQEIKDLAGKDRIVLGILND